MPTIIVHNMHLTVLFYRGYNEVGWHNKLPGPLPPPSTALEALPDQVSLRFTMKRYDAEPAQWQVSSCGDMCMYCVSTSVSL